ncbi:hypothetical protein EX30DRAFT_346025 [Ascodesmis nigricans]|uniref:Folliculin-interacting protein N-terminal domain-containing protein n=1 Tax=Ascodesmis nigricans TaxID=341454 RepID=A0A4V3SJV4_9PEZI|nr:hypothetical protein EX30DRAFT_346025 [Ascodesmis nigricans]
MLGRLFSSATSTTSSPGGTRPSTSHGSESDDLQTRLLLYPDYSSSVTSSYQSFSTTHSLGQSSISSINSIDNLDIDSTRDIRVIIVQDGSTTELKAVLYDSKPNAFPSPSLGSDDGATPTLGGPYGRSRRRTAAAAAPTGTANDELRVFADCMFGSGTLAYKGPSTKIHLLPNNDEVRPPPPVPTAAPSRRGSLRLGRQKEPVPPPQGPVPMRRKLVLVTRLFSVTLPAATVAYDDARSIPNTAGDRTPTPVSSVGSNHGFPFPNRISSTQAPNQKLIKPPRTSMYAVGIILSVPAGSASEPAQRRDFANPTPPSYDDEFPGIMSPSGMSMDSTMSDGAATSGCMNIVTRHWDVITRALSDLQHVAQTRIVETLTSTAGLSSPSMTQTGYKYYHRIELRKMALMRDEAIRTEVEKLRWRVASGIRIPRVVVGQGRWDVWQDEAQWAISHLCGRDMNFFFLTLLTAFLGHHTGWLEVLGPDSHKRRHLHHSITKPIPEHSTIPTRTVILSSDRIAARKLIYLLSAFIPSQPHLTLDAPPPPWIASSINYLSQSPPTFTSSPASSAPGSKIGSLRRKGVGKKPSKLNMVSNDGDSPTVDSIAGWDIPRAPCSATSSTAAAGHLPHAPQVIKKCSSSGTLATALSSATVLATSSGSPHKSSPLRPGSRDSSASLNLMGTLRRSGTTNTSADSNDSKWGSFLSFWSNPKSVSSVATSEVDDLQEPSSGTSPHELALSTMSLDEETLSPRPLPFSPVNQDIRCSVDEIDGTINVDIPLGPTFASPLGSPPQQSWLNPLPSVPNIVPMPPLCQPTTTISEPDSASTNVAGWIDDERFHPDFVLQAVPSYPAVEADVKLAMHMERTPEAAPVHFVNTPASENQPQDQHNWITVAETLIADTGKLQIKRVRLLRRLKEGEPDPPEPLLTPGGMNGKQAGVGATLEEEYEERWEEELMVDMDDTLATAVEKAIGILPRSPGSLEKHHSQESEGGGCRAAVLGALSKVVKEVVKEVLKGDGGAMHENVLTDGVKRWIWGAQEAF